MEAMDWDGIEITTLDLQLDTLLTVLRPLVATNLRQMIGKILDKAPLPTQLAKCGKCNFRLI